MFLGFYVVFLFIIADKKVNIKVQDWYYIRGHTPFSVPYYVNESKTVSRNVIPSLRSCLNSVIF